MSEDLRYNEEENGAVFSDEEMKKVLVPSSCSISYAANEHKKTPSWHRYARKKTGKVLKAADSTENKTKHSKAKRLLVRYGSLAACLAIVTLVGVNVLPQITKKSASMNDTASAYSLETAADVLISDENPAEEERSAAQSNAARNDVVKNSHMSLSLIPPVYGSAVIEEEKRNRSAGIFG